jgi:type VI secretion system protein ImpJ
VSLAGSLTTFSPQLRPRDLPNYDHNELGPILTNLDDKLRSLLETVVPTNVVSFALKLVRPNIYATELPEEKLFADTRMYLAVILPSST